MMFFVLILLAGLCLAGPLNPSGINEMLRSLSYPGVTFRRASVLSLSTAQDRIVHGGQIKLAKITTNSKHGYPSAASYLAAIQLKQGQQGFGNVSVVDQKANQYSVDVLLNGSPTKLLIDSGSSDTWLRGMNFTCSTPNTTGPDCGLGPAYPELDFPNGHITGQHFHISPSDNETIAGLLGYMDVEIAGINVLKQEIGLASIGSWNGDNVTSGVLGLAYPSLTSAYLGDDLASNRSEDLTTYSPLFTSMMTSGNVDAFWCLALDRNSTAGAVSFGELPPINLSTSVVAQTHLIIADIAHKGASGYQPSYYTIIPTGFTVETTDDHSRYPFIIDSSTTMTYVPPGIAQEVNSKFNPPAVYLWYYGSYFAECDAIPPRFAIEIEGDPFWINPQDMINKEMVDPLTGLCATTINNGDNGPFVLGLSFLTNAMVLFDVGAGLVSVYSREFY
ncbi:putative Acid protease [Seiridium cardinale]|uniref:Acid protease n=1 Tax=Seiridium cardinale TaxID=138064 RepID=A0ABR2XZX8_9PEZI